MDVLRHWLAVDPLDGVTVGHGDDPEALAAEFPACRIEGVQVTPPGGVVDPMAARHVACDNCAYSGSTHGHASHVKPGGSCENCKGGKYIEWVPIVAVREAVSEREEGLRFGRGTFGNARSGSAGGDYGDNYDG